MFFPSCPSGGLQLEVAAPRHGLPVEGSSAPAKPHLGCGLCLFLHAATQWDTRARCGSRWGPAPSPGSLFSTLLGISDVPTRLCAVAF